MSQPSIIFLTANQINFEKWDACVALSEQENIFMYSWSLNALCENWSGVVWGNYEAVLPLPWRKKWGLKYVYQVPFMAKLSIMKQYHFSVDIDALQCLLCKHFTYLHFDIDDLSFSNWPFKKRVNFILPLNNHYQSIAQLYSKECKKNIRKSLQRGCKLVPTNEVDSVFNLYHNAYGQLQQKHTNNNYHFAKIFVEAAIKRNKATVWHVKTNNSEEPIMAAILLHDKNKYYYWLAAPSEMGRHCRATYFFIDSIFQMYSQTNALFDFEGSDIDNVAHFYQQFSPKKEFYFEVNKICLFNS